MVHWRETDRERHGVGIIVGEHEHLRQALAEVPQRAIARLQQRERVLVGDAHGLQLPAHVSGGVHGTAWPPQDLCGIIRRKYMQTVSMYIGPKK